MSSESKEMKPKTDFDRILNYSNQYKWKRFKNDLGAGANADSKADKTFSATDPLSEIVWSPDKGFSLKCLDSSFTNKTTSLFRDFEPSSMVLALLQSVTCGSSTTNKPIDDVFVEPLAVICTQSDVSSTDTPAWNPTSDSVVIIPECKAYEEHDTGSGDNMEKMNTARGTPDFPNDQKENLMNCWEKNICCQANIETTKISEIMENKSSTISGQIDQRPVGNLLLQADESKLSMEQNPSPKKHCKEGMDTGFGNQMGQIEDDLYTGVEHMIEENGTGALGTNVTASGNSHSKKLELTAENDFFNCEATCAGKSGVLVSKSNENKNKSHVNEMILPCNKDLPVMHSPSNGRFHMTRNGSEQKSLSDGDSSFRLPKDEHDNLLSCESYHSTELLESRKRSKQEEQGVINGSKKVKKQIQETSYSKSYVKQDSSFMNLVSNMMKGYSQSSHDEEKPLALARENPDCHLLRPDQKLLTCNKTQRPELKNSGFKFNFQSMYCQSFENVGTRICHQVGEASKDFELRISCAENSRQYLQSSKFEVSKGGLDVGPSLHPQIRPVNFFGRHEHWKNNTVENENCCKSGTLGDLWITRFSPRSTCPLIFFDHLNERGGSQVHSTYCSMLPHDYNHISHLNNCKVEETREQFTDIQLLSEAKTLQNCCINKEACTGLKDEKGNSDHTSKHKFNHVTPFPRLRESEPMVSMFARKLGAIKQCQQTE